MSAPRLDLAGPGGAPGSPIHRLDPRAKLIGLVSVTAVAVTTPLSAWPVYAGCAIVLAAVAALSGVGPGELWARVRIVLPLVLLTALSVPFVRAGGTSWAVGPLTVHEAGLAVFAATAAKAAIGTVAAALLAATTSFTALLNGLERLRAPRLPVLIAGVTYRYLFVVAAELRRMRLALAARAYRPRRTGPPGDGRARLGRRRPPPPRAARLRSRRRAVRRARARRAAAAAGARMSAMVSARGLTFAYADGRPALRGIELDVGAGERVALLGPNGAGKTTLLLHLGGLLRGGGGELEVAGLPVRGATLRAARARVGLVFQDPDDQLFMPTVREDVAFGPLNLGLEPEEAGRRVDEALTAVRMTHARERAPHQLSMGERRRVAVATVLSMRPALLALDEPSANLDPRGRRELAAVLAALPGTLVLATHDLPLALQLCTRGVILADGRIVADAPVRTLLADTALLARHDLELPAGVDLAALPAAAA